jgi:hypothetical protein
VGATPAKLITMMITIIIHPDDDIGAAVATAITHPADT